MQMWLIMHLREQEGLYRGMENMFHYEPVIFVDINYLMILFNTFLVVHSFDNVCYLKQKVIPDLLIALEFNGLIHIWEVQ